MEAVEWQTDTTEVTSEPHTFGHKKSAPALSVPAVSPRMEGKTREEALRSYILSDVGVRS